MKEKIKDRIHQIEDFLIDSHDKLEEFKRKFVGAKSELSDLFGSIKDVPNEQKKEIGVAMRARNFPGTSKCDELDFLYQNRDAIGRFTSRYYWSSTLDKNGDAWQQHFNSGKQYYVYIKNGKGVYNVRAVRTTK